MKKLVVLGNLNWDLVFHAIPEWPEWGRELFIDSLVKIPGGIAHAAMAACSLGTPVEVAGCIGHDPSGAELISILEDRGIATKATMRVGMRTGLSAAIVKEDGERTYFTHRGALQAASPWMLWQTIAKRPSSGDVLLISGAPLIGPSTFEEWVTLVDEAHHNGFRVALDLGWDPQRNWPFWHRVLPLMDVVIVNHEESKVYLDAPALPNIVVIKSGSKGVAVVQPSGDLTVPGYPTQAVDTGGAGDVWNGAFLSALMYHDHIFTAAQWANAASSLYVSMMAGVSRYPTFEAVRTRVNAI